MTYTEYLQTDDWKLKRTEKLKQNPACEVCKSIKTLHVHHLNYRNWFDVVLDDLMVLCQTCHFMGHDLIGPQYKSTVKSSDRAAIIKNAVICARNLDGAKKVKPSAYKKIQKKLAVVNRKKRHKAKSLRCQEDKCPEKAIKGKRFCAAHYLARLNQDSLNRNAILATPH